MDSYLRKECNLEFFYNNGYIRKQCTSCGSYFWTLNDDIKVCGDQPCINFSFIGKPLGKKPLSLREVRDSFLSFFEKNNHSRLFYPLTGERFPVVARWRSDIYLTIASIADFQPHITSGNVPPPANPLVISQPCIRLNDLEEVGRSGRHLTIFEMMGHHAFNKNKDEIYWKEDTVKYCNDFFTNNIGISEEEITYKEQLWEGGGNAGPCLEVIAGGLEIATLVFMNMKKTENGKFTINEEKYAENPLNIVDTGYGLERIAWLSQGSETIYDSVFPEIISWLKNHIEDNSDIVSFYSLADHSKCLAFMLGDGIVPSNVKAGYLARLIIRRSLRFIEKLKLDITLKKLVNMQLNILENEFPSLKNGENQIYEILDIETRKFRETVSKGKGLVKRILIEKETIDEKELITLYDTHGMPPDIVKNIANGEGVSIKIPKNFDSMIAELHSHEKKEEITEKIRQNLPETIRLYYKDHYVKEFDAEVLWKNDTENGTEIILDKTAFYPEGGGQLGDFGTISKDNLRLNVKKVVKEGNSIIHIVDGILNVGEKIRGKIDWDQRYTFMKHHTGTHVVNGALRKLLGDHIWQAGSQIGMNEARFDFSHYKTISKKEEKEIENLANQLINQEIVVEKKIMDRNIAEHTYGFRLYQGGVPPGDYIRVINIPGIDVEACGGTHLNNIKEVEKIRILKMERIQDGVNRIIFAAGKMVDAFQREEYELYNKLVKILSSNYEIKEEKEVSDQLKDASQIFSVPIDQLEKTVERFLKETSKKEKTEVNNFKDACYHLFEEWKKNRKNKRKVSLEEIIQIKNKAETIPGTSINIITAISESESKSIAEVIIKEPDYIVHIYDGNKITSAASGNVDIDISKEIAPKIGKILGGSGGGNPKLTHSGGPKKDRIKEALDKAKKMTIIALTKH